MNKTNKKIIASTLVALGILASTSSSEIAIENNWDNIDNEVVSKIDNNVFSNNDNTSFYEDFMNRQANVKNPRSKLFEQLLNNIKNKANLTEGQQDTEDNISNNIQDIEETIEDNSETVNPEEKPLENLEETAVDSNSTTIDNIEPVIEEQNNQTSEINQQVETIQEKQKITPDSMFLTVGKNTSDDVIERNKIVVNSDNGFTLSPETEQAILNVINSAGKKVTFYITDPVNQNTISYNSQDQMFPASAIKAGMALLACKMVDAGLLNLDDQIEYKASQKSGGSGTIQYDPVGTKYTLREVIHRTINVSDNIGYYMLQDLVTKEKYDEMVGQLGCTYQIGKWAKWGYMCAQDLNLVWQEIYNSDRLEGEEMYHKTLNGESIDESEYSACAILNYELLVAKYNFLENAFPYDCSHKSGFNPEGYNDSGVVYAPSGNYIVSIMTQSTAYGNSTTFKKIGEALDMALSELGAHRQAIADNQQNSINENNDCEMGE